ncbi:MAG: histidine kinase [Clostridiales bacterium]|nr:histidine kinase [Clostridiales bacterium]
MKFSTKLLLNYSLISILSFVLVIVSVNGAIEYFGFATIEKQMIEKIDMAELSLRSIISNPENSVIEMLTPELSNVMIDTLKISSREVRLYNNELQRLGISSGGRVVDRKNPVTFIGNLQKALEGNYAYTVDNNKFIYFAIPIKNIYNSNLGVLELVEDAGYIYELLKKITYMLIFAAAIFCVLIIILSLYISRKTTKPIKFLLMATEKFSRQQFEDIHLNRKDELGMLAKGLDSMGKQLKEYIERQKQFISNVSHELKTPLAAISGFSQYLYDDAQETDPELRKIYYHLMNESERLTKLINELLLLSQFDRSTEDSNLEKLNLSELAQITVQHMSLKAEKRDVTFKEDYANNVFVQSNKLLLSQAIVNILDNAIKYSENHSTVNVKVFIKDNNAVLQVSDNGIGIPKEELGLIFERFYRAKNSKVSSGTGLGLSICKEIIEKYHGQMFVESEEQVGTQVTITLSLE